MLHNSVQQKKKKEERIKSLQSSGDGQRRKRKRRKKKKKKKLLRLPCFVIIFFLFSFFSIFFPYKSFGSRSEKMELCEPQKPATVHRTIRSDSGLSSFMLFSHKEVLSSNVPQKKKRVLSSNRTTIVRGLRIIESDRTIQSGSENHEIYTYNVHIAISCYLKFEC